MVFHRRYIVTSNRLARKLRHSNYSATMYYRQSAPDIPTLDARPSTLPRSPPRLSSGYMPHEPDPASLPSHGCGPSVFDCCAHQAATYRRRTTHLAFDTMHHTPASCGCICYEKCGHTPDTVK